MITIPTDSAPRRLLLITAVVLTYLAAIAWATEHPRRPAPVHVAFDSPRR
jgi:hypothetical protein